MARSARRASVWSFSRSMKYCTSSSGSMPRIFSCSSSGSPARKAGSFRREKPGPLGQQGASAGIAGIVASAYVEDDFGAMNDAAGDGAGFGAEGGLRMDTKGLRNNNFPFSVADACVFG